MLLVEEQFPANPDTYDEWKAESQLLANLEMLLVLTLLPPLFNAHKHI